MTIKTNSMLIHRADILAILVSSFLQGSDAPTLFALSIAFGVDKDFSKEVDRLKTQRVILLERGDK